MTASRPEGAKDVEDRFREVAKACTHVFQFDVRSMLTIKSRDGICPACAAALCVEYAREQVEKEKQRHGSANDKESGSNMPALRGWSEPTGADSLVVPPPRNEKPCRPNGTWCDEHDRAIRHCVMALLNESFDLRAQLQTLRGEHERLKLVVQTKGSLHDASTCTHALGLNKLRERAAQEKAALEARERATQELLAEQFHSGTRVTNCVAHMRLDFHSRPKDCDLCRTDITNHLSFAISVNEWLNKKLDDVRAALAPRRP